MTRSAQGPPRHRRGEPLRASWDPLDGAREDHTAGGQQGSGGAGAAVARGRGRVLAVLAVVLVVLTGFVVVRLSTDPADTTASGTAGTAADVGSDSSLSSVPTGPPVVGEAPRGGAPLDIPTAVLPGGGAFPVSGANTWHVVPGTTAQTGVGRLYTYSVEVEDGTTFADGDDAFATAVDATLSDPRSWVGSGQIAVRRVDGSSPVPPDFRVSLSSQLTTRSVCGYSIPYDASCWMPSLGRVMINGSRWTRGAGAFEGQLGLYRQYAVNHEVGHVFDNPHVPCPESGGLAPVMMQQTFGTSDDYLAQLTEQNPQGIQIPRDGKVCRPNPWPYPPR